MARTLQGKAGKSTSGPKFGLFVSTALASIALASCTASAPPAEVSFAKAQAALEDGKVDRAVTHAEAAVLAAPRNSSMRALLGASYLEAGRFQSAATAFGEAIELGDTQARTVLSYALAKVATGDNAAATSTLLQNEGNIPSADLGLALALAGQPERGVHFLINAVRNGDSSAKARQNLAYAYALAGNWAAARVMAAEDVPADQLSARLTQWASTSAPEDYQIRVSALLGIDAVSDNGLPQHLGLANFPSQAELVAEAQQDFEADGEEIVVAIAEPSESEATAFTARDAEVVAPAGNELVNDAEPVQVDQALAPAPVTAASSAPVTPRTTNPRVARAETPEVSAPVSIPVAAAAPSRSTPRFFSSAVVQNVPEAAPEPVAPVQRAAPAPQRRMAVATGAAATHLIQLGSFESRAVAESKWRDMNRRFPQLAAHDVVITEAQVNGQTFFRVAAAGFGRRSAQSMCNTVKSAGRGCFAYAAANPPAGAVNRGVRIAARTR